MAIRPITKSDFNKFEPARTALMATLTYEKAWYTCDDNRVIGTLVYDKTDKDYGWVILGKDERGSFRAIHINSSLTKDKAIEELLKKMGEIESSGENVFPQGD